MKKTGWNIRLIKERNKPIFIVEKENGDVRKFVQSEKGLFYCDVGKVSGVTLVSTVKDNTKMYSDRDYKRAMAARELQKAIGRPSTEHLVRIVEGGHLPNCPVTRADILAAEHIWGQDLGTLKGKTTRRKAVPVDGEIVKVSPTILQKYGQVTLGIDIMHVNRMAFLITISRHIKFGTVEFLSKADDVNILAGIKQVLHWYSKRGFSVDLIRADGRFESLRAELTALKTSLNIVSEDEHVPEIERYIRTVKERVRSTYQVLPFKACVPSRIMMELVYACVFWLNVFHPSPSVGGFSPRVLMVGYHIDYKKHCRLEFGSYVQTHEAHNNSLEQRTTGAIALRPTGNVQGGHYFYSLSTGRRLNRNRWSALPMPDEVVKLVVSQGRNKGALPGLLFGDRFGQQTIHDVDDTNDTPDPDDEAYTPDLLTTDDETLVADTDSFVDIAGVSGSEEGEEGSTSDGDNDEEGPTSASDSDSGEEEPIDHDNNDDPTDEDTVDKRGIDNVDDDMDDESSGGAAQATETETTNVAGEGDIDQQLEDIVTEEYARRYPKRNAKKQDYTKPDVSHRMPKSSNFRLNQGSNVFVTIGSERWEYNAFLFVLINNYGTEFSVGGHGLVNLTDQMFMEKGLKVLGERGVEAVLKEMRQLHDRKVMIPMMGDSITDEQKKKALNYLMFLKEKRCGTVKGRGCADGRPQRLYKSKEETASPTVSTEAVFLTGVLEAAEGRHVAVMDVPGAFMQTDQPPDEEVIIRLQGKMAEMLAKVDPELYTEKMVYEKGRPIIYARLAKALYGQLEASKLFYLNLRGRLEKWGFEVNPYDECVANKMIDGSQCTVIWHVDDLKISHKKKEVVEDFYKMMNDTYGQEVVGGKKMPVTVSWGRKHEYLGMQLSYENHAKLEVSMLNYIDETIIDLPSDMDGTAKTPATENLFEVNPNGILLCEKRKVDFHHHTAKLLFLAKRARPDILTAISFLCTRVKAPDEDDWKKLGRVMKYLRQTRDLVLTLDAEITDKGEIHVRSSVDAAYGVHPDMKGHTGSEISVGNGSVYSSSSKQKINTKSSTESELVGVSDALPQVIWTRYFLIAQGYAVRCTLLQDNKSAILLETNGRGSSGKRTRHIDIRYFFIKDRIQARELSVVYCPTEDMVSDYFSKPLQGNQFRKLRAMIMNED
ncbi:MAG: reverse transcriptase domain-containing protein [Bacteroidota bacterium]